MKRKALTITLAAVMAMGTCAVTASAADGDKYTIGICQLVQHEALDAATQGFKDEIVKELGEDAVTFDEQNAQGDSNTCSTIINSFVSNNEDLILANATASLQAAAAGTSDIPILGTAVTEYGVALDLKDFDGTVFPVLLTLLRWMNRQPCSRSFSLMQRKWGFSTVQQKQIPSIRLIL